MMNQSLMSLCAVLGTAWLVAGCNSGSGAGSEGAEADAGATGTIGLPLHAASNSGTEYRLRDASFGLWGYAADCYYEWDDDCEVYEETISSEDYLEDEAITVDLLEGYYEVYLQNGWRLEKTNEDGTTEEVEAVLLNSDYQTISISRHSTSWATYQFGIGDETLWLNGELTIDMQVYEDPDEFYNPTYGTCTDAGMIVDVGGYVMSGDWMGYAWTATEDPSLGSTISPTDFTTLEAGETLCANGTVAADEEYGGVAVLGLNLQQPIEGGEGDLGVWYPWGSGLVYDITNSGGSPLRIQIQGAAGYPDEAWCVPVSAGSGMVSWWDFNTHCWDNSGDWYDGMTPLETAMILVPGDNTGVTPFDFCANCLGVAY